MIDKNITEIINWLVSRSWSLTDNGRNSYRRIPAVHERGLAYFARHLADKMRKRADVSKSGQDEPDVGMLLDILLVDARLQDSGVEHLFLTI